MTLLKSFSLSLARRDYERVDVLKMASYKPADITRRGSSHPCPGLRLPCTCLPPYLSIASVPDRRVWLPMTAQIVRTQPPRKVRGSKFDLRSTSLTYPSVAC